MKRLIAFLLVLLLVGPAAADRRLLLFQPAPFPLVAALEKSGTASGTSHSVTLPTSQSNELLVIVGFTTSATVVSATGWTGTGVSSTSHVIHKLTTGGEGASASFTTSGTTTGRWHAYRVQLGKRVEFSSGSPGGSADPSAITPSWGSKNMLVITFAGTSANTTVSGFPDCSGQEQSASGSSTVGSCWVQVKANSYNPTTFTFAAPSGLGGARSAAIIAR